MPASLNAVDRLLRGEGEFAPTGQETSAKRGSVATQLTVIVAAGMAYGAVMGSFGGLADSGWKQALVSAVKVPFLFMVTFLICLPSFFVLNVLSGLQRDFQRVLTAVLSFQAVASLVLASVGPIIFLMNVSTELYGFMVLCNGVMFGIASLTGHGIMRRHYRVLIASDQRHRALYRVWILLYTFVGIQMAWTLRPFIGAPDMPVQFFRHGAWGNAYVVLWRLIVDLLGL
jgi:hypothetical protein